MTQDDPKCQTSAKGFGASRLKWITLIFINRSIKSYVFNLNRLR